MAMIVSGHRARHPCQLNVIGSLGYHLGTLLETGGYLYIHTVADARLDIDLLELVGTYLYEHRVGTLLLYERANRNGKGIAFLGPCQVDVDVCAGYEAAIVVELECHRHEEAAVGRASTCERRYRAFCRRTG
mgnify:CR=1 FL=1